jgi:arylsulfatase A-like enzyme
MYARLLLLTACLLSVPHALGATATGRPNILLIVADDLGYADLGAYGSKIETPRIDALAADGILFTRFHTAPMCSPTRAMLLSGNNNGVAGVASQSRFHIGGLRFPGYEGGLSSRVAPLPGVLRDAGYDTYLVGKWHLGHGADQSPYAAGFSRSFSLLDGGGSHFDNLGYFEGGATFREDEKITAYPDGEFSTGFYTDKLIGYIEADRDNGRPFFAFASYTAPHWPLQVPDAYRDLYTGYYDDGYDALRERRLDSLKEAGIIPLDTELPPRNPAIRPWDELSDEEKRRESRKMEIYAAMVDNLDDHLGRLLDYLRSNDLYDNTLIVVMGDNGAAAEDFYNAYPYGEYTPYIHRHFDNRYENMGSRTSFVSYGPQWAEAGSAPFKRRKGYLTQGGIVAPMIISGAGVARSGLIDSSYVTAMDLAPTFIEAALATYPQGGGVEPMRGESMVDFLQGKSDAIHDDDYVTVMGHRGRALVRKGRWKIVTEEPLLSESQFGLYDMVRDPGEIYDLSDEEPEILSELLGIWRSERRKLHIAIPADL